MTPSTVLNVLTTQPACPEEIFCRVAASAKRTGREVPNYRTVCGVVRELAESGQVVYAPFVGAGVTVPAFRVKTVWEVSK